MPGIQHTQTAFAPVRGKLAGHGAVGLQFGGRLIQGKIIARIGSGEKYTAEAGIVRDDKNQAVVLYDKRWAWNG